MTDRFDEPGSPSATETQADSEPVTPDGAETPKEDLTLARFTSCRWHATQEDGGAPYCSHRDVLPYAGMNGFQPEAWCPECDFFKIRRNVKKRRAFDLDDD